VSVMCGEVGVNSLLGIYSTFPLEVLWSDWCCAAPASGRPSLFASATPAS